MSERNGGTQKPPAWTVTTFDADSHVEWRQDYLLSDFVDGGPIYLGKTITSIEDADGAVEELLEEILSNPGKALQSQVPTDDKVGRWLSMLTDE